MPVGIESTIQEIKRALAEARKIREPKVTPPRVPEKEKLPPRVPEEEEIPGALRIALQRLMRLRTPQVYTSKMAGEMGIEIDPDWLLKISPGRNGEEPAVTYMSPEGKEVAEADILVSPEGRWAEAVGQVWDYEKGEFVPASREEIAARERWPAEIAPEKLSPEEYIEREKGIWQERAALFEEVYPELFAPYTEEQKPDIAIAFQGMLAEDERAQEQFLETVQAQGRTPETEKLLQTLLPELTEEDLAGFFGVDYAVDFFGYKITLKRPDWWTLDFWLENFFKPYGGSDLKGKAAASFLAGIGDVISTSGGAARWLGYEDVGKVLSSIGAPLQRVAPPPTSGEFEITDLADPEFYATTITRAIPFCLSLAPMSIGGFYGGAAVATAAGVPRIGAWIIGGLTGAALSRPAESAMEAGGAYDDAIARGKTEKEAREEANEVFRNNMVLAGADAFEIAIALAPTPKWVPTALVKGGLVRTAMVGGKMVIVGLSEGGEELYQDMIARRARGEDWQLDPIAKEVFAIGLIMGMGMGLGGHVISSIVSKSKGEMSPSLKKDFDKAVSDFEKEGFTTEQAELRALDRMAETPEGEQIIKEAIKEAKVEEEAVVPEVKVMTGDVWNISPVEDRVSWAKIAGLEGKLGSKAWADLTAKEQDAIRLAREEIAPAVKPEVLVPEVKAVQWINVPADIRSGLETQIAMLPEQLRPAVKTVEINPADEEFMGITVPDAYVAPRTGEMVFNSLEAAKNDDIFFHEVFHAWASANKKAYTNLVTAAEKVLPKVTLRWENFAKLFSKYMRGILPVNTAEYAFMNEHFPKVPKPPVTIISKFTEIAPIEFNRAIDKAPRQEFLTRYTSEELEGSKLFLSEDKLVGYAVKPDGELFNIFNASGVKGAGQEAMVQGIVRGATSLNCMSGWLSNYYSDFGFTTVRSEKWNEAFAPEGWDYAKYGRPDIIWMKYPEGETRDAANIRESYRVAGDRRLALERRGQVAPDELREEVGRRRRRAVPVEEPRVIEEPVRVPAEPVVPPVVPPVEIKPKVAPKVPITTQLKDLYSQIGTEVKAFQVAVKGLTGEEARVARETLKGLERELQYTGRTLETFLQKPDIPEATVLRSTIMAWARMKGLPKAQLQDIFSSVAGRRQLRVIPQEQLVEILDKVRVARPKRIYGKTVITPKTEKKIATLKDTLIRTKKLTEKSFNHLMDQFNLPTAKYEYAHKFITESEAKTLIRAMNDEAVLAEWDIKVEESLDRRPDIKTARDAANARSIKEREVTFDEAPIRIKRGNELRSMRYYVLKLQKEMDAPIYDTWQKINMAHLAIRQKQKDLISKLEASTPEFEAIVKNEEALTRVENYIAAKHKMGPKSPADITAQEIKLANELERQLFEFRNDVRQARFMEAYAGHSGDVDMIARDIPDANKRALRRAADIFEGKGATELRKFLDTQEWGVIRSGYNPLSVVKPKLHLYTARPTTFAKGHIQTREGTEYTTEDRTIIQRYRSYTKQMMGLTDLSPLVRAFDRVFTEHAPKLENYRPVANVLSRGLNEMKGYREDGGFLIHMMERMYATVASAVFWRPDLVLRNKFQNFAFNPDYHAGRFLDPRNKFMSAERRAWFETFVSQEKGIEQDYLLYSERPIPGLKRLTDWAHRTSLYPWSDKSNRAECFMVRMNRVDRALTQYEKDGDVKRLINNSGLLEFEPRQQAEALELLALDSVDYGIEGVPAVSGEEAFARYNAQQLVNNVHFLYDRAQRAPAEMGAAGKTLGNILVFSRSWAERLVLQGNKLADPKVATREKILATRIIVGIVVAGLIAGEAYKRITGKTHNPYNPLNILTWTPGGLIVGVTEDISNVMYWMTQAIQGNEKALGKLPGLIATVATLTLPFYKNFIQAVDSITDMKGIDVYAMRKIREMIDEEYEVRGGVHEVERTLLEKLQHALLAGKDKPDTPQEKVADAEEMLGLAIEEEDMPFSIEEPDIYDMRKLYSLMKQALKDIPTEDITKKNDYSERAIAQRATEESEAIWETYPNTPLYKINADPKEGDTFEEYYNQWRLPEEERKDYKKAYLGNFGKRQLELLRKYHGLEKPEQVEFLEKHPELKDNLRNEWLKANPIDNARLAIWGQAKILSMEAYNEVKRLIKELDIPDDAIPKFTLPPEGSVENYFKYNETGEEFGWNSWEVQLLLAQDDDLREFLEREPIDTPTASLELKVKHRELFDLEDAYRDKDSPEYIEDKEEREEAVNKLRADNPEWVDDTRRIEAIEHGAAEEIIGAWVERGNVIDEFSAGSSEAKVWLIDHPEAHKWALDQELLTDDGTDWNVPALRINVKWRPQDDQYEGMSDEESEYYIANEDEREAARELMKRHPETGKLTEYGMARYRRDAYSLEGPTGEKFPENQIENYVKYYDFPAKGFRQERFLLENAGFGKAMHEIAGIDLPDPKKVPAVQYDEIYEKWQADFERLEGLSDHESEHYIEDVDERDLARDAMRFDTKGRLTDFGVAEIRQKGYGLFVPEKYIDRFVEFDSLRAEKRQVDYPDGMTWYGDEWYLFDHPLFYKDIYRGLFGLDEIEFDNVPHSKWRGLWEDWTELDFQYEGVSDRKSEFYIADEDARKEYRERLLSTNPEYRQDRRKRDALLLKLPDDYLDDYAGYYEIPFTDKAKSLDPFYKEHPNEPYYEDDWYLKEHLEFYEAMLALRDKDGNPIWEPRKGFDKVPTREVHAKYKIYLDTPEGKLREDLRWENRDLDAWLLLTKKITVSITEKRRRAALTPQERLAEELKEMEERLKGKGQAQSSEEFGQSEESAEEGMNPAGWREEYAEGTPHWATDMEPSVFAKEFVGTMKSNKAESVLEIGCGNGRDSIQFAKSGFTVTSVDLTPKAVDLAKKNAQKAKANINFRVANAEKLPFGNEEFDSVFTLSVLHATELEKSLPELYRVLKPGGVAFIHIYADTQFKSGKEPEGIINFDDYLTGIKNLGFTVVKSYTEQEDKFDEEGEKHSIFVVSLTKGS